MTRKKQIINERNEKTVPFKKNFEVDIPHHRNIDFDITNMEFNPIKANYQTNTTETRHKVLEYAGRV